MDLRNISKYQVVFQKYFQEEELVVKWFFNASTTPFYQWVPALDVGPQVFLNWFSFKKHESNIVYLNCVATCTNRKLIVPVVTGDLEGSPRFAPFWTNFDIWPPFICVTYGFNTIVSFIYIFIYIFIYSYIHSSSCNVWSKSNIFIHVTYGSKAIVLFKSSKAIVTRWNWQRLFCGRRKQFHKAQVSSL